MEVVVILSALVLPNIALLSDENYTNPAMYRGWIRSFYPIGAQKVIMKLPQGARVALPQS